MIDLSKSGIHLALGEDLMLSIDHTVKVGGMWDRTVADMVPFLLPKPLASTKGLAYRVYNFENPDLERGTELRYDITVMSPGAFSFQDGEREFFRTAGHYHGLSEGGVAYPEIYEVLHGIARMMLQRRDAQGNIDAVYLVEAEAGEKIGVPPGFGHVTINAERGPLVLSNVIRMHQYDYESYRTSGGPSYRLLASIEPDMIEIVANGSYSNLPPLKKIRPRRDWFKGYFEPLWNIYRDHEPDIRFVSKPESYRPEFFEIGNLFKEIPQE